MGFFALKHLNVVRDLLSPERDIRHDSLFRGALGDRAGSLRALGEQHGAVLWARRYGNRIALVAASVSHAPSGLSPAIEVPASLLGLAPKEPGGEIRAKDLWTGEPVFAQVSGGELVLARGAVDSYSENGAFLIELSVV